jgi:1-acyl-sn-glycerol-3-phosphate acyltransferase
VFPEGTRSLDGCLLPFKRGGFVLAAKTSTPIVPVTIRGSQEILPKGAWRLRPGIVEIHISEPIPMTDRRPGTLRALATQVQRIIANKLGPRDAGAREVENNVVLDAGFNVQSSRPRIKPGTANRNLL